MHSLPLALTSVTVLTGLLALPPQAFVVRSAYWHRTFGLPPPSEVLQTVSPATDCNCLIRCLVAEECLSFSHDPEGQSCVLYNVRGNVKSPRPQRLRYRSGLAYLGDWCETEKDCAVLTVGAAVCQQNTCGCPEDRVPLNWTICGTATDTTTAKATTKSTETTVATTTTAPSASPTATTAAFTVTASTTTTTTPTTPTTTTAATTTTGATTATTTTPPTTTAATTTTADTTTTTTTTPPTTTAATTATSATTATATTTPPKTTADSLAPVEYTRLSKNGRPENGSLHLDCTRDNSSNAVLVGLQDDSSDRIPRGDLDEVNCATFLSLTGFTIGPKGDRIEFVPGTSLYHCPPKSLLVSLTEDKDRWFTKPDAMQCSTILSPHLIDDKECRRLRVADLAGNPNNLTWPLQCPQLPQPAGIVSLSFNKSKHLWQGLECCPIRPDV